MIKVQQPQYVPLPTDSHNGQNYDNTWFDKAKLDVIDTKPNLIKTIINNGEANLNENGGHSEIWFVEKVDYPNIEVNNSNIDQDEVNLDKVNFNNVEAFSNDEPLLMRMMTILLNKKSMTKLWPHLKSSTMMKPHLLRLLSHTYT